MTPLEAALGAVDEATKGVPNTEVLAATIRGLIRGYDAKWMDADYSTVSVEEEFHLPIINPNTGKPSRTFTQAGKKDGIVEYNPTGKRLLREGKTTSEDISDPDATYWRRLVIDSQVSCYVLANWQEGTKLDGTLFDVVRKPGIRPKKLSKAERQQIVVVGEYFGTKVSMESREYVQAKESENPELYEARLAADSIDRHEHYFQRRVIPRMDSDILEYAHDCWETANAIREARNTGHYFRNTGACMNWNTPCEFLGICSGHDSFDSDKWKRRTKRHDELENIDGADVLTFSSMQCFKTCHRKYKFRYEDGYERAVDDDREALYFGTIWHLALEAWWNQLRPNTSENRNDNGNSYDSPVNEVGESSGASEAVIASGSD